MSHIFKPGDLVRVKGTQTTGRLVDNPHDNCDEYPLMLPATRCGRWGMGYTSAGHYFQDGDGAPDLELIEEQVAPSPGR